jgi:hypothetical protein
MAAIQTILETIFQYPATALFKDFKDLLQGHKPFRNTYRILMGAAGAALGGVGPTVLVPEVSHYAASIVSSILPLSGPPSYITGNLALVYLGLTSGLVFGKYSAQAFYYYRHHDTNSGHVLYHFERDETVKHYQALETNKALVELRVEAIHRYLVAEIRHAKSKYKGNPLEPVALAWTKDQLKGVLTEFMKGNDDPYVFLFKLAAMKNNFLQIRLQQRVAEIEQVLVEELPQAGQQALSRSPAIRHRRRDTIDENVLYWQHPKLHRYVSQVSGLHKTKQVPSGDLDKVKTLLLKRAHDVRRLTQEIPKPLLDEAILRSPQPFNRVLRLDV